MDKLKELIITIQILAGVVGVVKLLSIIFSHSLDDDKSIRNKKLLYTLVVIVIIETITVFTALIKGYYV